MKRLLAVAIILLASTSAALAYRPNGDTTKVTGLRTWNQAGAAGVIIDLKNGSSCVYDSSTAQGRTITSLATSALLANRDVAVWCEDATITYAGHPNIRNLVRIDLR
jgi:hypothetical protein